MNFTFRGKKHTDKTQLPPHPKQLAILREMGYRGTPPTSLKHAIQLIEAWVKIVAKKECTR